MRYLVLADLEGVSCVFTREQCTTGTNAWRQAKNYLTSNLNAVIEGIYAYDTEAKITVRDLHNQCYNVNLRLLDSRVKYIGGPYHKPIIWFGDLEGYDLAFMVGIHARSGSQGFYAHTQCLEFAEVKVNGKSICEVEITASLIAESVKKAYPIGFVSGEKIAITQATESLPWLIGVPIQKYSDLSESKCLISSENQLLSESAQKTVKNIYKFKIFKFELPLEVEIAYYDENLASKASKRWKMELTKHHNSFHFFCNNTNELLIQMTKMMYLTPLLQSLMPLAPILRLLYRFLAR